MTSATRKIDCGHSVLVPSTVLLSVTLAGFFLIWPMGGWTPVSGSEFAWSASCLPAADRLPVHHHVDGGGEISLSCPFATQAALGLADGDIVVRWNIGSLHDHRQHDCDRFRPVHALSRNASRAPSASRQAARHPAFALNRQGQMAETAPSRREPAERFLVEDSAVP